MRKKKIEAITFATIWFLSALQCPVSVMAQQYYDNNVSTISTEPEDEVEINAVSGTIEENYGTVNENLGTIEVNENGGRVNNNNGLIIENNSIVENNDVNGVIASNMSVDFSDVSGGYVDSNEGTILTNHGLVAVNDGVILSNAEGALVLGNNISGYIAENNSDVFINLGVIISNDGEVGGRNEPDAVAPSDKNVMYEGYVADTNSGNFGIIQENQGTIIFNAGNNDSLDLANSSFNVSGITWDDTNYQGGVVEVNDSIIVINNGTINENNGIVKNNRSDGIVVNYEGGSVEKNSGKVYHYGGVVEDNSQGTEYFSVNIRTGRNMQKSEGNLTEYNNDWWIAQNGNERSSTEIIVTPSTDYYISNIKVPKSLASYVTATGNADGTWTILVKSGVNVELSIPNAIYRWEDRDTDSNDEKINTTGQNPVQSNGFQIDVTMTGGIIPAQQNVLDETGNSINVDLSQVFKPLKNRVEALNHFPTTMALESQTVQGYGSIDLTALFENQNAETISVPVSANVSAGQTYTIYLNDGTKLEILCMHDGKLVIPFAKGTENVTFLICGQGKMPPTK